VLSQPLEGSGKSHLTAQIGAEHRLLILPNPAAGCVPPDLFYGNNRSATALPQVEAHGVEGRVVKKEERG